MCSDGLTNFPCENAVDGIADGTNAHQWMTSTHHNGGHWFQIFFDKFFRVDKVRFKQLTTDYKQIKDLRIDFQPSAGSVEVCFEKMFPLSTFWAFKRQGQFEVQTRKVNEMVLVW